MRDKFKKPRVSAATKNEIKKEVQAVIKTRAETKYVAAQWDTTTIGTQLLTTAGADLYPMIPTVGQGTDTYQRIGDAIKPTLLRTKFVVYYTPPPSNSSYDVYVRFLCVSSKSNKSFAQSAAFPGGDLLDSGNGTTSDVPNQVGGTSDNLEVMSLKPVNKRAWNVHHDKIVRLVKNCGAPNAGVTAGDAPNLPGLSQQRFIFSTPHKAALRYEGTSAQWPTNFAPYWCAFAWTSDGTNYPGSALVSVATRSELYYTDS